jgi:16S rRNA (cytidine1402-2'-O)-methyltransferase
VPHTLVFFESPHRVVKSLEDMLHLLGDRRAAVCRELTKRFEQVERGVLSALLEGTKTRSPKGEYCIVLEGTGRRAVTTADREERLRQAAKDLKGPTDLPLRELARQVALKHGLPKREVYQLGLQQKREEED